MSSGGEWEVGVGNLIIDLDASIDGAKVNRNMNQSKNASATANDKPVANGKDPKEKFNLVLIPIIYNLYNRYNLK